jgi:hypothetical protein
MPPSHGQLRRCARRDCVEFAALSCIPPSQKSCWASSAIPLAGLAIPVRPQYRAHIPGPTRTWRWSSSSYPNLVPALARKARRAAPCVAPDWRSDRARLADRGGTIEVRTGEVSVRPYASVISTPVTTRNRSRSWTGRGAAPEQAKRMEERS